MSTPSATAHGSREESSAMPYEETSTGDVHLLGLRKRRRCLASVVAVTAIGAVATIAVMRYATDPTSSNGGAAISCGSQPAVDVETGAEFSISAVPPLPVFTNAVFCGHLVPDADSAASAIAGALLFDGVAALAAAPNKETEYLFDRFAIETPPLVADVYSPGQGFVLVDHNAQSQIAPVLLNDARSLKGIFDHHPYTANSAVMSTATFVEKQVWGSCATILATKFLQYNVPLMPNVAGLILGAIISDTLNFKSPTTTDQDKRVAGWLAPQVNWPETHTDSGELRTRKEVDYAAAVFALASEQFTAKSNLSDLTATEITLADFKQQPMPSGEMVGWGQCETVDPFYTSYLQNSSLLGFVDAMRAQRDLQSLDFMYVSYVDIWSAQLGQSPRSSVVCLSKKECDVLKAAFPGTSVLSIAGASDGAGVVDTSPRVSRKLQFIPAISAVLI